MSITLNARAQQFTKEYAKKSGGMDMWKLRYHEGQAKYMHDLMHKRFVLCHAGRRSGKTAIAKKALVIKALSPSKHPRRRYVCAAPTRPQAESMYWEDMKMLVPDCLKRKTLESKLSIDLINGSKIVVMGMDNPKRIEGDFLDGVILDEYADMKKEAWTINVKLALADRKGFAWLIGVPEGQTHFYELAQAALRPENLHRWGVHRWDSADILTKEEMDDQLSGMDEHTARQELCGEFLAYAGRAYYAFDNVINTGYLDYMPNLPLILCLDFNISPGIAVVVQEQPIGTCVIGEVHIPRNSNTESVCNRFKADWQEKHCQQGKGAVHLYGDQTGGNHHSTGLDGSDWDIVNELLGPVFDLTDKVPSCNPSVRGRINSLNTRCKTAKGKHSLFVDRTCKHMIKDLDGVTLLEGGTGEIDKKRCEAAGMTHMTDALGYYVEYEFPLGCDIDDTVEHAPIIFGT